VEKSHRIRVALYTKQPFVARGLAAVLHTHTDMQLAACPDTLPGILACLHHAHADVLLVDLAQGISLSDLREIRAAASRCQIALWGQEPGGDFAFQAMQMGVRSILPASTSVDDLLAAVRNISQGALCFEKHLMETVLSQNRITLTPRQGQIVSLVARGMKNKEIAFAMGICEGTVTVYLYKLFKKLGVNDRLELALYGLRNLFSGQPSDFVLSPDLPRTMLVVVQKQAGSSVVH
jgi:two-component system, NarL family, nitrate/nitrite response regulator NarL